MNRQNIVGKVLFALVCVVALLLIVQQPYNRLSGQPSITTDASTEAPVSNEDIASASCLVTAPEGQAPSTCGDQLSPEQLASIEFTVINAPPTPPAGIERPLAKNSGPLAELKADSNRLAVPTSSWTYGSAPTAAGMLFAYYDRNGFPDLYTGPSNGGVCPLTNVGQGIGTPISGSCSIIATQNGFDGQVTDGHVDDFWFSAGYAGLDPWEVDGIQRNWGDCTADYMGSNQWNWSLTSGGVVDSNIDGDTVLFSAGASKLYDFVHPLSFGMPQTELCHGLRLFAESRGYAVSGNYTQGIDTMYAGGFSFAEFQAEIDAGNPVLIHLISETNALTVVGVGYKNDGTVLLNDTWDNLVHTMVWGGDYAGYTQLAVSAIQLDGQSAASKGLNPAIVSVTSSLTDGSYTVGQVVPIQVTFDQPVTYTPGTGQAQLQLETGTTDQIAPYSSGSGTLTLTFNYTVAAGDTSIDLEYLSTTALTLTADATIRDFVNITDAILTLPALATPNSLGGSKAIVIDTTAPTVLNVTSSVTNGTYIIGQVIPIQVTFDQAVNYIPGTGVAQLQLETGSTDRQAPYSSGTGTAVLTFDYTIVSGDISTDLQYLSTGALSVTGTASIKDTAGNDATLTLPALASASSLGGSKAIVLDAIAPFVSNVTSTSSNGIYTVGQVIPVQVTFNQVVNYLAGTGLGQLQLETGATDRQAPYASGTGTTTLIFNYTVQAGDTSADLEYLSTSALTLTGTASIKEASGNNAVLTLPALASGSSLGGNKALVINTAPPVVTAVTSSLTNATYTVGQIVPVQVTFNKAVTYLAGIGVAQLQLETGTTDQQAPYASGSGTTILTFNYTVQTGDASLDLEYLSTGALTLTADATIRDAGAIDAILTLPTLGTASSLAGSKAIVIDTNPPTVSNVTSTLANGSYTIGQVVPVRVTFNKAVNYSAGTGVAQIQLETGTTDRIANYSSGTGTTALIFNYTVVAGDIAADLEYLDVNALTLTNDATIKDISGLDAVLTLPAVATANSLGGSKAIVIDTTAPTVSSVTSSVANATYTVGQVIPVQVTFNQAVNYVAGTGLGQIQLETGSTDRQANYTSGTGTATLTFNYTVVAGDASLDLEYLNTGALTLTGTASIKDAAGNNAVLALPALATANSLGGSKAIVVDTTAPVVVNVTSSLADGSYKAAQVVPVQVTFNKAVTYVAGTGVAQIQLETGFTDRLVNYASGSGTTTLTFNYTVVAGDSTFDLEYLSEFALTLTGTASIKDAGAISANLTLPFIFGPNSLSFNKDIEIDTTAPTVLFVTSSVIDGTYTLGQVVPVDVFFNEPVIYTPGTGLAQIQLETGTTDRQAPYVSGSGTSQLTFNYTIVTGDSSVDLQYLSTSALALTGTASIKDVPGNNATLTLPALASGNSLGGNMNIVIDAVAPTVSSVTSSLANGSYGVGQVVPIQVTFSQAVAYTPGTGLAQIQLETGSTDRQVAYTSGSGTSVLTFNYTVQSGDASGDLQYVGISSFTLTGTASIKNLLGSVNATLTLPALATANSLGGSKAIVINTGVPTVSSVTSSLANGSYSVGQVVPIQVTFSQAVNYLPGTGIAQLQLETGTTDRQAPYASGTGTATLTFNYTVVAGDTSADLQYLSTTALTLTGTASIKDAGATNAVLTLPALASASSLAGGKAIVIDTTSPTVTAVTSTLAGGTYTVGQVIPVRVTFNQAVTYIPGTGLAQLQLETGATDRQAPYASGSGTTQLIFNYTIVAGDISLDLEYLSTTALTLTGTASIRDAAGNNAVLTLPALGSASSLGGSKAFVINTTSPTVVSVTSSLVNGTYTVGQLVPIQVNFSKVVNYTSGTGEALLLLETGITDQIVSYSSGSGTATLTFNYTVQVGDTSADLQYFDTGSLILTGSASIADVGGVTATLTLPSLASASSLAGGKAIVINTAAPTITSVTSTMAGASYSVGTVIPVRVTFNKIVVYTAGTGVAQLLMETGTTDRQAPYVSGSGTTSLTFNYTVQAGDTSADLDYASINALTLTGTASIEDTGGVGAVLTLPAVGSASSLAGAKAFVIDTTSPTVLSVSSSLADGAYTVGQVIPVQVTFDQLVNYVAGTGLGQIQLETGTTDRLANYASGTATATLTFNYTVVAGDTSSDLQYLNTDALALTGTATIKDAAGNTAVLTLPALASASSLAGGKAIVINTVAPTVVSVTSSVANGEYGLGQVIPVQVIFDKAVTYTAGTGVGQLQLETGVTDRQALYASGTGTTTLTFNYTVTAGDTSFDLEYVNTGALTLTGTATMTDAGGITAILTLPTLFTANSLGGGKDIVIDSELPVVLLVSSSLADGSYSVGQVIPIDVFFSKPVNYTAGTGVGQLQLETGATDRQAPYANGTGSSVLTFNYTVAAGDTSSDLQYLSTGALTYTGTASIKDSANNNATVTLPVLGGGNSLADNKDIVIDTAAPTVTNVTSSLANGSYIAGQVVPVQVTFNKTVFYTPGTGLAQLQLETGATDRQAPYSSGSGTTTLTFNYTVTAGDTTGDLQYLSTTSLGLTGTASIKDAVGNNAVRTLPILTAANSLAGNKAIVIDTTAPTVTAVSSTLAGASYGIGAVIPVRVTFSSNVVYVPGTGVAQIQLETGATDRQAPYASGSGTAALIFNYTVQAGDISADLQYLNTSALTLTGSASIKDPAGNNAVRTLPALSSASSLAGSKAFVIDTAAPTVTRVTSSLAGATYTVGQVIPVSVTFNQNVFYTPGTGVAQIQLETGATDRQAPYASGSGTTVLTFNYTIQTGDTSLDLEYVSTSALTVTGSATIRDAAGNDGNFTLPALATANSLGGSKAIVINTAAPVVTKVSSTKANGTYSVGQVIPVTVTFNKSVNYTPGTGVAQIQLETGATDRQVAYTSGTGTKILTFNYTIQAGDSSADLQYLSTAALTLTGSASIADLGGIVATTFTLPLLTSVNSLAGGKAIVINTSAPVVTAVTSTVANGTYTAGQVIPVRVTFNKAVTYTPGTGLAQIQLETGATDRQVVYTSGTGTVSLIFNYTVQAGDASPDLQYLSTAALTLTGTATIKDAGGINSVLTLPALASASSLAGSKAIVIAGK